MADLIRSFAIASSGMAAQARRLNLVSQNIANVDTPGYRRKTSVFEAMITDQGAQAGVRLGRIGLDDAPLRRVQDPGHPLAGADGTYLGSNVDVMVEVADAREAHRSYEANLRSFDNARQMTRALLDLLRK